MWKDKIRDDNDWELVTHYKKYRSIFQELQKKAEDSSHHWGDLKVLLECVLAHQAPTE